MHTYDNKPARAADVLEWLQRGKNLKGFVYLAVPAADQQDKEETLVPVQYGRVDGENMILYVNSAQVQMRPDSAFVRHPYNCRHQVQEWSTYWLRQHVNYVNYLRWKRVRAGAPEAEREILEGLVNMFGALYDAAISNHNILILWNKEDESRGNLDVQPQPANATAQR